MSTNSQSHNNEKRQTAFQYIEELSDEEKKKILGGPIVVVDPGTNMMAFFLVVLRKKFEEVVNDDDDDEDDDEDNDVDDDHNHKTRKIKYKRDSLVVSSKGYRSTIGLTGDSHKMEMEKIRNVHRKGEKTTIKEVETTLAEFPKKSCSLDSLPRITKHRTEIGETLFEFSSRPKHRNKRLEREFKEQRWRGELGVKLDSLVWGEGEKTDRGNCTIIFGDFAKGGTNLKFNIPTMSTKLLKIVASLGFKVLLVNEFRTSSECPECLGEFLRDEWSDTGSEITSFPLQKNKVKRPTIYRKRVYYKKNRKDDRNNVDGATENVHGVLYCCECKTHYARDVVGARCIELKAMRILKNEPTPPHFDRIKWCNYKKK